MLIYPLFPSDVTHLSRLKDSQEGFSGFSLPPNQMEDKVITRRLSEWGVPIASV